MDYNTQREKLIMPEYGRHVQKMVQFVKALPEKDKRNEQVQCIINVMGTLNPQLRDINDFRYKLWDHVHVIADFDIDIDSIYKKPTREELGAKPNKIPIQTTPIKATYYGRNIQNMIQVIADRNDDEVKTHMIKTLAHYMMQQYIIWNKDTVTEDIIFRDIVRLSDGKIVIPEGLHINMSHNHDSHQQRNSSNFNRGNNNNNNRNNGKNKSNKRWKK